MVIGAFVRGLSMRDVESLCEQAGLGKLSKTTASRICQELRERFERFKRRDLYDVQPAAPFLDAVFLCVRPNGPKQGALVAWGFTDAGERVLLAVMLRMRESHEDWLALGRDLIARGLGAPLLVVADGAPGPIKAGEQCWPASDRQHWPSTACATYSRSCPNGSASACAGPTDGKAECFIQTLVNGWAYGAVSGGPQALVPSERTPDRRRPAASGLAGRRTNAPNWPGLHVGEPPPF
jgi:Transposase, Mutator family